MCPKLVREVEMKEGFFTGSGGGANCGKNIADP
jgi:hypothetical protein